MYYYVNLNVSYNTFRKYLLELGFNVKVKDFDSFILSLKIEILNDFDKNKDDSDYVHYIFGNKIPPVIIYSDLRYLKFVTENYLRKFLNKNDFSEYFIEYDDKIDYDMMKYAYTIRSLEHIASYNIPDFLSLFIEKEYPSYFKHTVYESKIMYLIQNKYIHIDIEDRKAIFNNIIEKMKDFYFRDFKLDFFRLFDSRHLFFLIDAEKGIKKDLLIEFFKEKTFDKRVTQDLYYPELEVIGGDNFYYGNNFYDFFSKYNIYYKKDIHKYYEDAAKRNISLIVNYFILNKEIIFDENHDFSNLDEEAYLYYIRNIEYKKEDFLKDIKKYLKEYPFEDIKYVYSIGDNISEFSLEDINKYIENKLK